MIFFLKGITNNSCLGSGRGARWGAGSGRGARWGAGSGRGARWGTGSGRGRGRASRAVRGTAVSSTPAAQPGPAAPFPPRCALAAICGFTAGSEILVGGGWDVSRTQSHRWFRKPWCGWVQLKSQRWPMTFAEPGADPVHRVPY